MFLYRQVVLPLLKESSFTLATFFSLIFVLVSSSCDVSNRESEEREFPTPFLRECSQSVSMSQNQVGQVFSSIEGHEITFPLAYGT